MTCTLCQLCASSSCRLVTISKEGAERRLITPEQHPVSAWPSFKLHVVFMAFKRKSHGLFLAFKPHALHSGHSRHGKGGQRHAGWSSRGMLAAAAAVGALGCSHSRHTWLPSLLPNCRRRYELDCRYP